MTTTLMNAVRASVTRGSGPNTSQTTNVPAATSRTIGTKTSAMRSARCWIGALLPWARWTARRCGRARCRDPPASRASRTCRVRVERAADDRRPGPDLDRDRLTGEHARVDRRCALDDLRRRPAGFSPGRTRRRSPTATASSGNDVAPRRLRPGGPSSACSRKRRRMAPVVLALARRSSQRPSSTRPMMIVDESK